MPNMTKKRKKSKEALMYCVVIPIKDLQNSKSKNTEIIDTHLEMARECLICKLRLEV